MDESSLHDADQGLAVGRDGQALHAFVGRAAAGVVGDFIIADRLQIGDERVGGEFEGAQAHAKEPVKFIDVRAVLVGDVNPKAVVGNPDTFGVQAAIVGVAGIAVGVNASDRPVK